MMEKGFREKRKKCFLTFYIVDHGNFWGMLLDMRIPKH